MNFSFVAWINSWLRLCHVTRCRLMNQVVFGQINTHCLWAGKEKPAQTAQTVGGIIGCEVNLVMTHHKNLTASDWMALLPSYRSYPSRPSVLSYRLYVQKNSISMNHLSKNEGTGGLRAHIKGDNDYEFTADGPWRQIQGHTWTHSQPAGSWQGWSFPQSVKHVVEENKRAQTDSWGFKSCAGGFQKRKSDLAASHYAPRCRSFVSRQKKNKGFVFYLKSKPSF